MTVIFDSIKVNLFFFIFFLNSHILYPPTFQTTVKYEIHSIYVEAIESHKSFIL